MIDTNVFMVSSDANCIVSLRLHDDAITVLTCYRGSRARQSLMKRAPSTG
jgi:hypothetical protein